MITRRTFCGAMAAGAAVGLMSGMARAAEVLRARNVVLVAVVLA